MTEVALAFSSDLSRGRGRFGMFSSVDAPDMRFLECRGSGVDGAPLDVSPRGRLPRQTWEACSHAPQSRAAGGDRAPHPRSRISFSSRAGSRSSSSTSRRRILGARSRTFAPRRAGRSIACERPRTRPRRVRPLPSVCSALSSKCGVCDSMGTRVASFVRSYLSERSWRRPGGDASSPARASSVIDGLSPSRATSSPCE